MPQSTRLRLSMILLITILGGVSFLFDARPAAAQLPPEVDTPEYWLQEFARSNSLYQAFWTRPVDGPHEAYARSDGSLVAWVDTRYALPAYLDLYHWSKDTQYLDWFVMRMTTLLTYRRDVDGDGSFSWATAKYWDSLVKNGDFERQTAYWSGLTAQQILTSTATTSMLVVPRPPGKCTANLPSTFLARYYAQLRAGERLQQSYESPASTRYFRLRLDVTLPAGSMLSLKVSGRNEDFLAVTLQQAATRGPEGWQRFAQDFSVQTAQPLTITLEAASGDKPTLIDNLSLTPYLDMFTGDMQMASVLANFALLVDEHPELAAYQPQAEQYTQIAEEIIAKYQVNWRELDPSHGVYMISEEEPYNHPYNHVSPAGEALLMLSRLNEGSEAQGYLRQAKMLAETMKSQMRPNTRVADALSWNYMDALLAPRPNFTPRVEDTTHAGNSVPFLAWMHSGGYVFGDDDIRQITNAFNGLWNGSYTEPLFLNFLDSRPDLVGIGQFPYMRHVTLAENDRLEEASMLSWLSRARKVQCIRDAESMSNGWIMSLPAAILRQRFAKADETRITLAVEAEDGPATPFLVAGDLGQVALGPIQASNTTSKTLPVAPGTYRLRQVLPAKWVETGARCTLTGGAASKLQAGDLVVKLAAGEDVTCTFRDEYRGPTVPPTRYIFFPTVSNSPPR